MKVRGGLSKWTVDAVESMQAGSIVYPPKGTHGPRVQSGVQLVTLHSGALELHLDERILHVKPGEVVLLLPGQHEFFIFSRTEDSWHRWLTLMPAGSIPIETIEQLQRLPAVLPLSEAMNKLVDIGLELHAEANRSGDALTMIGLSALHLYEAETTIEAERQRVHRAVTIAKAEIRSRYMEPLTLPMLAAAASVSQEHLIRLFRQHERMTPGEYIWKLRLQRSKDLLRNTGLAVGEIAERTGFKNTHHFSRLFKQEVGQTPTAYRAGG